MNSTTTVADAATAGWRIRELEHAEADDEAVTLLTHLRPDTADLARAIAAAAAQHVRYVGAYEPGGRLVALAGGRMVESSRGRVLHVDDLVTDPSRRGMGAGGALLSWLEEMGFALGCQILELDSSVTRSAAHRFYARAGLSIGAFHFTKPIAPTRAEMPRREQ